MGESASGLLEVITTLPSILSYFSGCMSEVDLNGPDLAVCLTCMPFFVVSTISSEAAWGKEHPSTKWSKPPHLKYLWAEVLTTVTCRMVAIKAWSMVVKGQLW